MVENILSEGLIMKAVALTMTLPLFLEANVKNTLVSATCNRPLRKNESHLSLTYLEESSS